MKKLLVLMLVVMLAGCGQGQPTLTAAPIPAGWEAVQQKEFSLALPIGWEVVSSEDSDVEGSLDAVAEANPVLSPTLQTTRQAFTAGQLRLAAYAFDTEQQDEQFVPNVTVGIVPAGGSSLKQIRAVNLKQLQANGQFKAVSDQDATLGGLPAFRLKSTLDLVDAAGATVPLQIDQTITVYADKQYIVTLTATTKQSEQLAPTLQQLLDTVRLVR